MLYVIFLSVTSTVLLWIQVEDKINKLRSESKYKSSRVKQERSRSSKKNSKPRKSFRSGLFGMNNDYALRNKVEDLNQNDVRDWNWRDQIDYNYLESPWIGKNEINDFQYQGDSIWFSWRQNLHLFAADCVRERDRGEGADEDDGAALLDALGKILYKELLQCF